MSGTLRPLHRGRNLIIGFILAITSLGLCLGLLELTGKVWEDKTAQGSLGWTLIASRRLDLERHGTDEHPFYVFAPFKEYNWKGIDVRINSRGFRDLEFSSAKQPDITRILNVGDSTVFGWEVGIKDVYGTQLEDMLNGPLSEPHYEVINAGIPGWSIEDARNFILVEGLDYAPDVVIVAMTVVNDIYGKSFALPERPTLLQRLRDNTYGWPFLTTQLRFLLSGIRGPEAFPVLNPPNNAEAYFPLDEQAPAYAQLWSWISDIDQACRQRNIKLVLVVFPTAMQVDSAGHPDIPQRVMRQRADAAGIGFVDMLPIYRHVCQEAPRESCEGYENLLFADAWMHPNELGHRLAADALFRWLQSPDIHAQ